MGDNLESIYHSFVKLLVSTSTEEVYKTIVMQALSLVGAEYGSILLATPDNSFTKVYTNVPKSFQKLKSRKKGFVYKTYSKKEPRILTKDQVEQIHPEFNNEKIKSIILIPISFNKTSLGVLSLQSSKKRYFTKKRKHLLKLYGSMAALKIKNSMLLEETNEALATRDLFISMASHELRTPITTVSAYSQLLMNKNKNDDLSNTEWMKNLNSEVNRLSRVVKELLDIDHILRGKFQYKMEELSIIPLVDEAARNFSYLFPKRELIVNKQTDGKLTVNGDHDKLLQVLENILINAVKFSFDDSPVEVRILGSEKNVRIDVINRGPGVDKKSIEQIFNRFYKVNAKSPGMGLGLYISKTIIDEHKGQIYATSRLNKETTFTIEIPLI